MVVTATLAVFLGVAQLLAAVHAATWHSIAYPFDGYRAGGCPTVSPAPGADLVIAPVVTIAYNRPGYLDRTLTSLVKYWPPYALQFPLFVSIDGGHEGVREVAYNHSKAVFGGIKLLQHVEVAGQHGYVKLAAHYRYVMQVMIQCFQYPRMIYMEDDLEVSPDFFSYFAALAPVLDADKSLWCVSAWNDHALTKPDHDPTRLYRTDFMPGLGWMLRADTAHELLNIWPRANWDDWMRLAHVRKGRQCIFPEESRTYTFGKEGTSGGQFWSDYLSRTKLTKAEVKWNSQELLQQYTSSAYQQRMRDLLCGLPVVTQIAALEAALPLKNDTVYVYNSKHAYAEACQKVGIIGEFREGIPRMSYSGMVVAVVSEPAWRLFLVPEAFKTFCQDYKPQAQATTAAATAADASTAAGASTATAAGAGAAATGAVQQATAQQQQQQAAAAAAISFQRLAALQQNGLQSPPPPPPPQQRRRRLRRLA